MKVNFLTQLVGIDGEILHEDERPFTLGRACVQALLAYLPEERISGTQRADRFELAMKIHSNGQEPIEVSSEEIVKIKEIIGMTMATVVVGQTYRLLEGKQQIHFDKT